MQLAPIPSDEELRIKNLLSYGILDSGDEKDFDDLAELIAQVCNCRFAMITFMDKERNWIKASRQIGIKEVPRDISFCAYTILQDDVMVINDAKNDVRFLDNPHVTGGFRISFYVGAPIVSAAGYKLGAVCAMDPKAKAAFSPRQKKALKIIANQVTVLLELGAKNKLALAQSDALVAEEKKIVQLTLTGQDDEKSFIANELHENFAQTLAATKLYLDSAEQSKELSADFIRKSKSSILQIIKDIKTLSKSILPTTFEKANYLGFIREMLNEYGKQHDRKISFRHEGKLDCYDSKTGFIIFRILQYQLKNAHTCGAKKISIKIKADQAIRLELRDNGKNVDAYKIERGILLHHIETRIGIIKGKIKVGLDKNGNNLLEIEIPLAKEG